MNKNYVGEVDVLKFAMCLVIYLMHLDQRFGDGNTFFGMGGFAVEVFFAISGCLMCASAEKANRRAALAAEREGGKPGERKAGTDRKDDLASQTICFVAGKIKPLILPYLIVVATNLAIWFLKTGQALWLESERKFANQLLAYIPNFLLLSMGGALADDIFVNISWYLSAMLIAMFFLYPLLRKFGRSFRIFAAPAVVLFGTGILYQSSESYKGIEEYVLYLPQGLWRAFIGLCLGCIIYEAAARLRGIRFTKAGRWLLTVVEAIDLVVIFAMFHYVSKHAGYTFLIFDFVLLAIVFSKQGIWAEAMCRPFARIPGKASMYVYLLHVPVLNILKFRAPEMRLGWAVLITAPCIALLVALVWMLSDVLKKKDPGKRIRRFLTEENP